MVDGDPPTSLHRNLISILLQGWHREPQVGLHILTRPIARPEIGDHGVQMAMHDGKAFAGSVWKLEMWYVIYRGTQDVKLKSPVPDTAGRLGP